MNPGSLECNVVAHQKGITAEPPCRRTPWQISKDWAGVWCLVFNRNHQRPICVSHLHTFEHVGRVHCITISRNGEFVATGGRRSAQVFHVESGNNIATFEDSDIFRQGYLHGIEGINVLRFSPDAKLLVTGGEIGMIKVWDVVSKSLKLQLNKHTTDVRSLDVSRDGAYLVSGSSRGTIILWDFPQGHSSRKLPMKDALEVSYLSFSPNSTLIAAAFDSDESPTPTPIMLWNIEGLLVARLDTQNLNMFVVFSPKSDKLFAGAWNANLWESSHNTEVWKPVEVANNEVCYYLGSGLWVDERLCVLIEGPGDFYLWDLSREEALFAGEHDTSSK